MVSSTVAAVDHVVEQIERAGPLDPVAKAVRAIVHGALRPRRVKDTLHGVWFGHPLHPVLTDVPIGLWTAAAVLDVTPGGGPAANLLIATGCTAALPTALTGWADWSDLRPAQQRVGLVHALANIVALGCYAGSVAVRGSGRTLSGKALAYTGFGAVMAGGYLGGHLAFRQAAGVNHSADIVDLFPSGWHDAGPTGDLPDGRPAKRTVAGIDLAVVRRGQHIDVLAAKCSHLAGPLAEGEFTVDAGQGCLVCPWHGSTFRLADGAVVHGPATAPQRRFETQVIDGRLQVRLLAA